MSLFRFIFLGIPETIALVTLVFVIAKAKINWKKIIFLGVLLTCTAYLLRLIPITFGVHTLVNIGLLIFLMTYLEKVDLIRSIISVLIGYFCLIVIEAVTHMATLPIFNLSVEQVINNEFLLTVSGIPQVILLFLIAFIVKKYI